MALEEINFRYAISSSEIPEEFLVNTYVNNYNSGCYVYYDIEVEENRNDLDRWIVENYPELENEKFLIHID